MPDQASLIAKTIVTHLRESNQITLLTQVIDALKSTSEFKNSQNHVLLTSAIPLTPKEVVSFRKYLNQKIVQAYDLVQVVDSSLVAGFTLQINDTFVDASILGKINSLQNKLTAKE